jgi:hypothetical protein
MKLLYCTKCGSVFNLDYAVKTCLCGETKGYYDEDGINATYSGENSYPIGIDNITFRIALVQQPESGRGWKFDAFVIPKDCPTFEKVSEIDV